MNGSFPSSLTHVAVVSLAVAGLCALLVLVDVLRRPQPMGVMNVVEPEFWLLMQLAMVVGFATAYPVNWLLIRRGLKEKM